MSILTEGRGLNISRVAKSRRVFLCRRLRTLDLTVLEIGALDNPTFIKSELGVYYADFFSQEESQARHARGHRSASQIVPVDFVLRDSTLSRKVSIHPDLTIANHVIEHIASPIDWLQEVRSFNSLGGYLFLSVPDKRFTFDYFKPLTDAVDWLRAHDEQLTVPTFYQILRHLYYHAGVDAAKAWEKNLPEDHLHRISFPDAIAKARSLCATYTDVHCWIFTYESFCNLFRDLEGTGLIPWKILDIADVEQGSNEFRVLLQAA